MDVLFVGGGPAGLAGAIELARLVRADADQGSEPRHLEIGVLEKAAGLGEHCLSGAVVDPAPFRELFPGLPESEMPFRTPVEGERVLLLGPLGNVIHDFSYGDSGAWPAQADGGNALSPNRKSKRTGVLLALLLGPWTWLYTRASDGVKFRVGVGLSIAAFLFIAQFCDPCPHRIKHHAATRVV